MAAGIPPGSIGNAQYVMKTLSSNPGRISVAPAPALGCSVEVVSKRYGDMNELFLNSLFKATESYSQEKELFEAEHKVEVQETRMPA